MPIKHFLFPILALATFSVRVDAQVFTPGGGPGGAGGNLTCSVLNTGNPTQVRPQDFAGLLGDIVIQCIGGALVSGTPATVNVAVSLHNTIGTSRVFGNGLSEALLLIDEPGAGPGVGAGGTLPQTLCSGGVLGAGPGGCETQVGTVGSYYGAVLKSNPSVVPNVFQAVGGGGNEVLFNGIPIVAPVTAGFARVFRITNLRANANQFAAQYTSPGTVPIRASVSIGGGIQLGNAVQTIAYLFDGFGAETSVRNAANTATGSSINITQCVANSLTAGATLRFSEGFAAAFKTRIAPTGSLSGAGTPPNSITTGTTFVQNTPAQILPGSESAFILPVTGGTAGLADFGTRLKATFNNVPAGVSLYVSTTSLNGGTTNAGAVAGGNFSGPIAGLVTSESASAAPGPRNSK